MKKILLLTVISFFVLAAYSQQETGVWASLSLDKKINKKWNIGVETDIRTIGGNDLYFVRLIDRWSFSVNANYSLFKPVKLGVTYMIMNKLDTKYANYQWRNRILLTASGKQKWGDFSFSLRERLQITTKNDSKRIKDDGSTDTYAVNPDLTWRNRFQIVYDIPKSRFTPAASFETFYSLNDPSGNKFDELRYILSLTYKIDKHNFVELYGVYNYDPYILMENMFNAYVIGVGYKIEI
ncbi:MAG: DUF2490 domain-containing protein [Paludibacter sp.]|jgi:hypothetical protein|nr:DUF2490 domain-containing protein [Paludibacter sp.]